jgi:hypothetical protein
MALRGIVWVISGRKCAKTPCFFGEAKSFVPRKSVSNRRTGNCVHPQHSCFGVALASGIASMQDFAASMPATRGSLPPLDPASLSLFRANRGVRGWSRVRENRWFRGLGVRPRERLTPQNWLGAVARCPASGPLGTDFTHTIPRRPHFMTAMATSCLAM